MELSRIFDMLERLFDQSLACTLLPSDYPSCNTFWAVVYLTGFILVFIVFILSIRHLYNEDKIKRDFYKKMQARAAIAEPNVIETFKWNPLSHVDDIHEPELANRIKSVLKKT